MRKVEVAVGFTDKTWLTYFVEIPDNTPEDNINKEAEKLLLDQFGCPESSYYIEPNDPVQVAFCCVYNLPQEDAIKDGTPKRIRVRNCTIEFDEQDDDTTLNQARQVLELVNLSLQRDPFNCGVQVVSVNEIELSDIEVVDGE